MYASSLSTCKLQHNMYKLRANIFVKFTKNVSMRNVYQNKTFFLISRDAENAFDQCVHHHNIISRDAATKMRLINIIKNHGSRFTKNFTLKNMTQINSNAFLLKINHASIKFIFYLNKKHSSFGVMLKMRLISHC